MKFILTALSRVKNTMRIQRSRAGFTMIELLIVIAILGILAVAVLSAINPVEQINRGRDTGTRSDAEQLLSAIDRFNAFQGFFPWQEDADDTNVAVLLSEIDAATPTVTLAGGTVCPMLERLTEGGSVTTDNCIGAQELKSSFAARIANNAGSRALFIYNRGNQGDSTYICFVPQSNAFLQEAQERCDTAGGIPADLAPIETEICNGDRAGGAMAAFNGDGSAICLP